MTTRRDAYIQAALTGVLASLHRVCMPDPETNARLAVQLADATIEAADASPKQQDAEQVGFAVIDANRAVFNTYFANLADAGAVKEDWDNRFPEGGPNRICRLVPIGEP